jgi:hypothetical protein
MPNIIIVIIIIIIIIIIVSNTGFPGVHFLEPVVHLTTQASSFEL